MSSINTTKVIVGGLVAGLIINISEFILNVPVLGAELETALKAMNLPPVGGGAIAWFVFASFVLGVMLVWLYAAIRPRYGPGPKTAICAGVTVWFLAYFWSSTAMLAMGLFPGRLIVIGLAWGLVELVIAAIAGAWLYTEGT